MAWELLRRILPGQEACDAGYLARRFTTGYGLVEVPFEECLYGLTHTDTLEHRFGFLMDNSITMVKRTDDPGEALSFLTYITIPTTRHIAFPAGKPITALLNNGGLGSDFNDYVYGMAVNFGTRAVRVVDQPKSIINSRGEEAKTGGESRIIDVRDPQGKTITAVLCMHDGDRWSWSNIGDTLPVESTFQYDARRVKDRFTSANLRVLLAALGFPAITAERFLQTRQYALLQESHAVITGAPLRKWDVRFTEE